MDKISVIVPVYMAETYLRRCLESIVRQSYDNLEVILVNDGSPDACPRICAEYAREDDRVIVINSRHGGASSARNAGIANSTGKYLLFVDADDYLQPDMVGQLHAAIADDRVDLVVCGYFIHDAGRSSDGTGDVVKTVNPGHCVVSTREIALDYWGCYDRGWINPIWNKMYKASVIVDNGLRFPENVPLGEDGNFNGTYLLGSSQVRVIDLPLYHYCKHPRQSSRRRYPAYFQFMTDNYTVIETFVDRNGGFENRENRERHQYEFFCVIKQAVRHIAHDPTLSFKAKVRRVQECLDDRRSRRVIRDVRVSLLSDRIVLLLLAGGMCGGLLIIMNIADAVRARNPA